MRTTFDGAGGVLSDRDENARGHWVGAALFWWALILAYVVLTSALFAALSFVAVVTSFYSFGESGAGTPAWLSPLYAVLVLVVGWALAAFVGRSGARFSARRGWVSRPWWVPSGVAVAVWLVLDLTAVVYFVAHQQGFAGGALAFSLAVTAALPLMWGQWTAVDRGRTSVDAASNKRIERTPRALS